MYVSKTVLLRNYVNKFTMCGAFQSTFLLSQKCPSQQKNSVWRISFLLNKPVNKVCLMSGNNIFYYLC